MMRAVMRRVGLSCFIVHMTRVSTGQRLCYLLQANGFCSRAFGGCLCPRDLWRIMTFIGHDDKPFFCPRAGTKSAEVRRPKVETRKKVETRNPSTT